MITRNLLSEETEVEVFAFLRECLMSSMFGDSLEDDYINDGFPTDFKGLHNMTNDELLKMMTDFTGEDEDLVVKMKAEIAVNKMTEVL